MNLRRYRLPSLLCLLAVTIVASGQNVFVTAKPDAATTAVSGYSELLQFYSSITPAGAPVFQVLPTPAGERLYLVSQNTTSPLQVVNVVNGQYVAGAVIALDGLKPVAAAMSPDGTRLAVVAVSEANVGTLFILDTASSTIIPGGRVAVSANPTDVIISAGSRHAFVLSGSQMFAVDLASAQSSLINLPASSTRMSLSPTGSIYVCARYLVTEYESLPPFTERGRISTLTDPGRISVTPDGRYGITINNFGFGSSIELFDFNLKSTDPSSTAGSPIRRVPILDNNGNIIVPDQVLVVSNTRAVSVSNATGRLFDIVLPSLQVREIFLSSAAGPPPYTAIAVSDEYPTRKSLYILSSNGAVTRYDLNANSATHVASTQAGGNVLHRTLAIQGTVAQLFALNTNQIVGPEKLLRPYYVKVVDANGKPLFGQTVTFSAPAGITFSPASAATNVDGFVMVQVTSPAANGNFSVRATVGSQFIDMVSTVQGGGGGGGGTPSFNMVKVAGDGTLMGVGGGARRLVLRVVNENGQPLPNTPVTWGRSEGISLDVDFNPITVTDEKGETSVFVFPPGFLPTTSPFSTFLVTAATSFGNTSFRIIVYPSPGGDYSTRPITQLIKPAAPPYTINLKLGQRLDEAVQVGIFAQGGSVSGVPMPDVNIHVYTIIRYDDAGQPVFNTDPTKGPVTRCDGNAQSNASGIATCNLVAEGKVGTLPILIDIGNGERAYTGTVVVAPGDAATPQLVSGDAQTGKVGELLPTLLQARTTDAYGNVLSGTAVVWEVVTPGSVSLQDIVSTSNSQGIVSARARLGSTPGNFQVRVKIGEKALTFNMTALPIATSLIKVSGDPQPEGFVNETFSQPLVVLARDAQGSAVANVVVNWAVTGGVATPSSTLTTTDATGRAQILVTAGATPGPIVISASSAGLGSVTFNLQSRLKGPVITSASFSNLASGELGVAPGALVIVKGNGMAPGVTGSIVADLTKGRLPYELNGTTVVFQSQGINYVAPVYQITAQLGEEFAVVQVPFEITGTTISATVRIKGGETVVSGIPVRQVSPGIIEENYANGRRAAVVIRSDGLVVTPETPARLGEIVRMYAVGLGQTTPEAGTNRVGVPDQRVNAAVAVGVDDKGVQVISAHMAENLIGVYEIVFAIPQDAVIGPNRPLGFVMEATPGQPVYAQGSIIAIGAN